MNSLRKHLLCIALMLCMLVSLAPMTALAAEKTAEGAANISAVLGDGARSISEGAADEKVAVDLAPGDYIDRELYDTDFQSRDGAVSQLSEAMIARKNEIYLYWRSDIELTEADIDALMADALLLDNNPLGSDYLAFHVLDYYAEWQAIVEGGSYYNIIGFAVAYSTTAEQELELTNKVENMYSSIVGDNNNHYWRVKNIYDWMIANVEYDMDNILDLEYYPQHTAYAAMVDGKASAIGMSLLFHRMASSFGVESGLILGTIDGNDYVWNAVNIYGTWYQVNVSYDILTGTNDCFLRGYEDLPAGHKLYDQFLTPEFLAEYPFAKTKLRPEASITGSAGEKVFWTYDLNSNQFILSGEGPMADDLNLSNVVPFSGELPLYINEGITYIGRNAFKNGAFHTVFLPDSLVEIGNSAFERCNTRGISGGQNVKVIGDNAFNSCNSLTDYTLPAALESIGEKAFYDVPFTKAEISAKVKTIGNEAFYGYNFEGYVVDEQNPNYSSESGVLYNKDKTALLATPNVMTGEFVLPKTVTKIGDNAFQNRGWLRSVKLHEGITEIGKNAFNGSGLQAVIIPSTVTVLPDGAFAMHNLEAIYLPTSITYIGKDAITSGSVSYGGTEEQWKQMGKIENDFLIYNGVKTGANKLYGRSWTVDLDKMELEVNYYYLNDALSAYKDEIVSLVLVGGGDIPNDVFNGWTGLQTVTVKTDQVRAAENAFAGCTGLTDVYFNYAEPTWIANGFDKAFPDSPNLTVHMKEVGTSGQLGDALQWSYDKTTHTLTISGQGPMPDFAQGEERPWDEWMKDDVRYNVVFEEGVTYVGANSFTPYQYENRYYNIRFASTIKEIGARAFYQTNTGHLILNEGLEKVNESAFSAGNFEWDEDTKHVLILPDTLVTVENYAFAGTSTDRLYLPVSLQTIGENAFGLTTRPEIYYGGTEAQWKQMKISQGNYALLTFEYGAPVYEAGCPHLNLRRDRVEPTCTETGLTRGKYCAVCGVETEAQQVIERTTHSFTDAVCIHCGMKYDPSWPLNGSIGGLSWSFHMDSATLILSGEGEIPDYADAKDVPWNVWSGEVLTLNMEIGVTAVGDNAFAGFHKLNAVNYDGTLWQWQRMDIGSGNESLTNAKLNTAEVFTDVLTGDWFYGPVNWAVSTNVTGGLGNGLFGPNNFCTRAQVVTFLYAAAGKPEVTATDNPFEDVADDAWYAKPVLWAVENGITSGIDATHFGPDVTCTRAQVVTFLYAAAGKPEITAGSTFDDVADADWYAKPVIWAKENDVTGGISATEFGPNQTCTRAQVVTFLNKVYGS